MEKPVKFMKYIVLDSLFQLKFIDFNEGKVVFIEGLRIFMTFSRVE